MSVTYPNPCIVLSFMTNVDLNLCCIYNLVANVGLYVVVNVCNVGKIRVLKEGRRQGQGSESLHVRP